MTPSATTSNTIRRIEMAFDFVEMFRFAADLSLLYLLRKGWRPRVQGGLLDYESRKKIIEALFGFLEEARVQYVDEAPITLRQAMKKAAFALASYLRGDGAFEGFVYRW
jgi:CRISPR-associated protein Cas1